MKQGHTHSLRRIQEPVAGLYHWTAIHPEIEREVHSYYFDAEPVAFVIDPMVPEDGLDWFDGHRRPRHVFLTNRLHLRDSARFTERFHAEVWCHEAGLKEFASREQVRGFAHGGSLPGGVRALPVGALTPEETAFFIPHNGGALSLGDSVIRGEDEELRFVPEEWMGEDPGAVRHGLERSLKRILAQPFQHLLLAHGTPRFCDGHAELRRFLQE